MLLFMNCCGKSIKNVQRGDRLIKPEGRTYIVYKHTNKINGKVYIGITCQTPERRWQKGAGYAGTRFGLAIQKYGWDAFSHDILAVDLSEQEACEEERKLICEYKSNERNYGYNLSAGGEVTDCIAKRIGKNNHKSRSVLRINPKTGEKRIFETITEAEKEMNINHRGISKACRGVNNTYMGYIWEYADSNFEKPKKYSIGKYPHTKIEKAVTLIEPDGVVKKFKSLKAAGKSLGIRANTISRYISGLRKDASGRKWVFS